MTRAVGEAPPPTRWRGVGRGVVSLAACCAALVWLLAAWFVWTFRCDENCGGHEAESWEWTGQAVVAVAGAGAVLVAVVLGFTSRGRGSRTARLMAGACAVLWLSWLFVWGVPQR